MGRQSTIPLEAQQVSDHTFLLMMIPASFARLLPCLSSLHMCMKHDTILS